MVLSEIKPAMRVVQERWSGMEFLGEFAGCVVRITPKGHVSIRWDDSGRKSAVNPDYLRADDHQVDCPLCGSRDQHVYRGKGGDKVVCLGCGAHGELFESWCKRTP